MTRPASSRITQALLWTAEAIAVLEAMPECRAVLREMQELQITTLNEWWRNA